MEYNSRYVLGRYNNRKFTESRYKTLTKRTGMSSAPHKRFGILSNASSNVFNFPSLLCDTIIITGRRDFLCSWKTFDHQGSWSRYRSTFGCGYFRLYLDFIGSESNRSQLLEMRFELCLGNHPYLLRTQ